MASNKDKPRYNPSKEKNPIYSKWGPANRGGAPLGFSVPLDEVPSQFDWTQVMPYQSVGDYSTDNYKLGANLVPKIMQKWPGTSFNDAVGYAANFIYESGGNPQLREHRVPKNVEPVNPKAMTGSGGYGMAQLTAARKKAFWNFVGRDPKRAADPMEQIAYFKAESEGLIPGMQYEKSRHAKVKGSKNPAQAAYNVAKFVERPGDTSSWPVRMATADSIAKYAKAMPRKPAPAPAQDSSLWGRIISIFD